LGETARVSQGEPAPKLVPSSFLFSGSSYTTTKIPNPPCEPRKKHFNVLYVLHVFAFPPYEIESHNEIQHVTQLSQNIVLSLRGFPLGFKADLFSLFVNEVFEKTLSQI
jgi:hypothetical protein